MYQNSMTSKHYPLFCELGYPQLDYVGYPDGEWAICEFENAPLVPALTKWRIVFSGFRNVEFNSSFAKKIVGMIDNKRQEFWDNIEAQERKAQEEREHLENERLEQHLNAADCLKRNPALMQRACEQGADAFSLPSILRQLSPTQVRNVLGSSVQIFH